ncbi:protein-export chaperone SecB [Bacillus subtilis]|uniref:Protein-export chaperone SecB n=1 Tax=Bacillus subtilis TaxID=1423 RepID=A0AAX3RQ60_BACIU|nr:protein-export chaperone SecB [Bacillus subtilis]WGD63149.1 protein-export chaperone SecB [Bacillus subtilis]WGD71066.1 protein-export chaperone SecB [Bacillus subtilis]WGD76339.1 protein-export chaperone SecB [Bacillus subtilis]WGD78927.1 protein-export chaperone SecB [Bacillus subtilis]
MRSILQFTDYHVTEINYKFDPFEDIEEVALKPAFTFGLDFADDEKNNALITLGIEIGDPDFEGNYFYVKCEIKGEFTIHSDDEELTEAEKIDFYKINGVSILYPYLRSLVSDVSSKGSETPIILPTMNVAKMIADYEAAQSEN